MVGIVSGLYVARVVPHSARLYCSVLFLHIYLLIRGCLYLPTIEAMSSSSHNSPCSPSGLAPPPPTTSSHAMSLGLHPLLSAPTSVPLMPTAVAQVDPGVFSTPGSQSPITSTTGAAAGLDPPSLLASMPTQPQTPASGFSLSPATQPFPQKLVDKIRSGQFVEMRELMADNISLMQQLEGFSAQCTVPALPGALKPRLREPTTLPSWMYCFLGYLGIQATDPKARVGLAYARLVIREAQRHGGSAWLEYDRLFRQQAAIEPALQWDTLHPGIQAATLIGRSATNSQFCTLCREPDHTADHCALSYLQQPSSRPPSGGSTWQGARDQARRNPIRTESRQRICISWNKGKCNYPESCRFRHVCATCQNRHMARDCTKTATESEYKQSRP